MLKKHERALAAPTESTNNTPTPLQSHLKKLTKQVETFLKHAELLSAYDVAKAELSNIEGRIRDKENAKWYQKNPFAAAEDLEKLKSRIEQTVSKKRTELVQFKKDNKDALTSLFIQWLQLIDAAMLEAENIVALKNYRSELATLKIKYSTEFEKIEKTIIINQALLSGVINTQRDVVAKQTEELEQLRQELTSRAERANEQLDDKLETGSIGGASMVSRAASKIIVQPQGIPAKNLVGLDLYWSPFRINLLNLLITAHAKITPPTNSGGTVTQFPVANGDGQKTAARATLLGFITQLVNETKLPNEVLIDIVNNHKMDSNYSDIRKLYRDEILYRKDKPYQQDPVPSWQGNDEKMQAKRKAVAGMLTATNIPELRTAADELTRTLNKVTLSTAV